MRLSGALQKKRTTEISYKEIVKNSTNDETTAAKQVLDAEVLYIQITPGGGVEWY